MKRFGFIYNPKSQRGRSDSAYEYLNDLAEDLDGAPIIRVAEQSRTLLMLIKFKK